MQRALETVSCSTKSGSKFEDFVAVSNESNMFKMFESPKLKQQIFKNMFFRHVQMEVKILLASIGSVEHNRFLPTARDRQPQPSARFRHFIDFRTLQCTETLHFTILYYIYIYIYIYIITYIDIYIYVVPYVFTAVRDTSRASCWTSHFSGDQFAWLDNEDISHQALQCCQEERAAPCH